MAPDPHTLNLIVRAGIRTISVDFADYTGGMLSPRHRARLHRTLDDAVAAINDEVGRSSEPARADARTP